MILYLSQTSVASLLKSNIINKTSFTFYESQFLAEINWNMQEKKQNKIEDMYNSKKLPRTKTLHPMKPTCCKEKIKSH